MPQHIRDIFVKLTEAFRPGPPRTVSDTQVADLIGRTLTSTPMDATHWSIRSMAAATGLERWFADELTRKQLQRGVHRSTAELEADIAAFIDAHNVTQNATNGSNPPINSLHPSNASAGGQDNPYEPNFGSG